MAMRDKYDHEVARRSGNNPFIVEKRHIFHYRILRS